MAQYRLSLGFYDHQEAAIWRHIRSSRRCQVANKTLIIKLDSAEQVQTELLMLGAEINGSALTSFRWINIGREPQA